MCSTDKRMALHLLFRQSWLSKNHSFVHFVKFNYFVLAIFIVNIDFPNQIHNQQRSCAWIFGWIWEGSGAKRRCPSCFPGISATSFGIQIICRAEYCDAQTCLQYFWIWLNFLLFLFFVHIALYCFSHYATNMQFSSLIFSYFKQFCIQKGGEIAILSNS